MHSLWLVLLIVLVGCGKENDNKAQTNLGEDSNNEAHVTTSVPSFPGAEGWGAQSVGGRGGQIIEVTNLNDAGSGSLRACVEGSEFPEDYAGPTNRICVFRVAGIIKLKSELQIRRPYITIAGQTAPGDGITLQGGGIRILTHNVIIRYIHWRSETLGFVQFWQGGDTHDVIVDHCSANGHKPEPGVGSGTMVHLVAEALS